jgi:predicted nucleic acid-binding protein
MIYALDTSVLVDYLRRYPPAVELIDGLLEDDAELVSSYAMRAEVLAGMRRGEERATEAFLTLIAWESCGREESDAVGALGRRHLPANPGIDTPDLMLADVALRRGAELLTTNVKHFKEMFPGVSAPYAYR